MTLFTEQIKKPDLVLFISRPVEVLLNNIKKRGRAFEKSIDGEYLQDIQDLYLSYFKYSNDKKVVVLKLEDKDFINNENLLNKIIDLINQNHNFGDFLYWFVGVIKLNAEKNQTTIIYLSYTDCCHISVIWTKYSYSKRCGNR